MHVINPSPAAEAAFTAEAKRQQLLRNMEDSAEEMFETLLNIIGNVKIGPDGCYQIPAEDIDAARAVVAKVIGGRR